MKPVGKHTDMSVVSLILSVTHDVIHSVFTHPLMHACICAALVSQSRAEPPHPDATSVAAAPGTAQADGEQETQSINSCAEHGTCSTAPGEDGRACNGCRRVEGRLVQLQETVDKMMHMMHALQQRQPPPSRTSSHRHRVEERQGRHGGMPRATRVAAAPSMPLGGMLAGQGDVPGLFDRPHGRGGNIFHQPHPRNSSSSVQPTQATPGALGHHHHHHHQHRHDHEEEEAIGDGSHSRTQRYGHRRSAARAALSPGTSRSMRTLSALIDSDEAPAKAAPIYEGSGGDGVRAVEHASPWFGRSVTSCWFVCVCISMHKHVCMCTACAAYLRVSCIGGY